MRETIFARGKRGEIFLRRLGGKIVAVKRQIPGTPMGTIQNEAKFNAILNTEEIGPKFILYDEKRGELVREFVEGIELRKWLPSAEKVAIRKVLLDILGQCRTMDELGVSKQEMTRPWKDILVRAGKPVLIDFERCRDTAAPKNVTQFCQFLSGTRLASLLLSKGISFDTATLHALAADYKAAVKGKKDKEGVFLYSAIRRVVEDG